MIGIKLLLSLAQVGAYIAVAGLLVLLFFFVVTWSFRLVVEGFRVGLRNHWQWFRGLFPRRKTWKLYIVRDKGEFVTTTSDPQAWISNGYEVTEIKNER